MGKRQRKKIRETETAKPPRRKLGSSGPFMVCAVCNEPVNPFTEISNPDAPDTEWSETIVRYLHNLEYSDTRGNIVLTGKDYGHDAVPVASNPIDASITCDFCYAPGPRWVFVPRRPILIYESAMNIERDFSSPWACCDNCLSAVKSRSITRMLDRATASEYSGVLNGLSPDERRTFRASVRELYALYLKSDPAGPYEVKIQSPHKPVGKRGSLRGM